METLGAVLKTGTVRSELTAGVLVVFLIGFDLHSKVCTNFLSLLPRTGVSSSCTPKCAQLFSRIDAMSMVPYLLVSPGRTALLFSGVQQASGEPNPPEPHACGCFAAFSKVPG